MRSLFKKVGCSSGEIGARMLARSTTHCKRGIAAVCAKFPWGIFIFANRHGRRNITSTQMRASRPIVLDMGFYYLDKMNDWFSVSVTLS